MTPGRSTGPRPLAESDDPLAWSERFADGFAWSCADLVPPEPAGHQVTIRQLWQGKEARALLVHCAPGARLPAGTVEGAEVLLLAGSIADPRRSYEAGTFIHVPSGDNRDWRSDASAEIFVVVRDHSKLRRAHA